MSNPDTIDRLIEDADEQMKSLLQAANEAANKRAMLIAIRVDGGPRGTAAGIARRIDVKQPAIVRAAQRGRELLAQQTNDEDQGPKAA